jgi:hypothetical protein
MPAVSTRAAAQRSGGTFDSSVSDARSIGAAAVDFKQNPWTQACKE